MAVNLGAIWFSIRSNVSQLASATRTVMTFGQTAQSAANQAGGFQRSLDALSTTAVLLTGPLGGIATRFQAIAASARRANLVMVAAVGGAAAAAYGFYRLTTAAVQATIAFERLQKASEAAAGSFYQGQRDLDFVADVAKRSGQTFLDLGQQFIFLNAAAKDTALEGTRIKKVFEDFAFVAAKLNLSTADTEGVFRALQQMLSKGSVQAEELRGQLGERLPGAVQAAADALGVTTAQLESMLKRGEVAAEDLLPRLGQAMIKNLGVDKSQGIESITANQNRFNNALQESLRAYGELTGAANAWNFVVQQGTRLLEGLTEEINKSNAARRYWTASAEDKAWMQRYAVAFGNMFGTMDKYANDWLQKWVDQKREAEQLVTEDMWSVAFPKDNTPDNRITNSELENWLKSQKTAGSKAAEGLREAQVALAKVTQEADVYSQYSGKELNIALRELNNQLDIDAKLETFTDALRTAGVATSTVTEMTEKYRAALEAVQNAKILNEETVTAFEFLQDTIGNGLTNAVDTFVNALGQGKLSMETLKDVARDVVSYMLSQFLKLAVVAPLMNSLFGLNQPVLGGGGTGGGIFGQLFGQVGNILGAGASAASASNQVNMNVNLDGAVGNEQLHKTVNEAVNIGIAQSSKNQNQVILSTVRQNKKRGRL